MHAQKHFLPLQREYCGVKSIGLSIYHRIETAHPQNCMKMQGVVFALVELVICEIEVSILIWKIIDTVKDNGDCTNVRDRNCSYSPNKQKKANHL